MLAGSVTRRTSTPASLILARVFSSLRAYSSSGNAAIRHLLGDLLRAVAPVEAAVHLDLAAVGHDVRARAAADRAHGEARRAEPGVGTARELRVDRLELECDPRGRGDRVAPQSRRGGMS